LLVNTVEILYYLRFFSWFLDWCGSSELLQLSPSPLSGIIHEHLSGSFLPVLWSMFGLDLHLLALIDPDRFSNNNQDEALLKLTKIKEKTAQI
jgi:hypothetical protein